MQAAARAIGYKIGFLFDNDKQFRKEVEAFCKANSSLRAGFDSYLEAARTNWANDLSEFRNKWLEHPVGERTKFDKFYTAAFCESLFEAVWNTIVEIMAVLLEAHFRGGVRLVEQAPDDPGPRWLQRFRYVHPAFNQPK